MSPSAATAVGDGTPLFHQVLQAYDRPIHDGNNVLVSLSPPGDEGYGPGHVRVATMSTHTRPAEWEGLEREGYERKKAEYRERMLSALGKALPEAPGALEHAEFASPRSFRRYTRRAGGAVGGPPVSRSNSNFLAVGSDVLGPGLWVVGDSVFPGAGHHGHRPVRHPGRRTHHRPIMVKPAKRRFGRASLRPSVRRPGLGAIRP